MAGPRKLTDAERRWLDRLQNVLDAQPKSLTIYCHGDTASVLDAVKERAGYGAVPRDADLDVGLRMRGWIAGDW